jgi:hypothetical protein
VKTYKVNLGAQAFVIKAMSARQFISVQRGTIDEVGLLEQLASSCVSHPFGEGADDFLDNCDLTTALDLLREWTSVQVEEANPKEIASV